MNILKHIVGIDIAKDTFVACYGTVTSSFEQTISKPTSFENSSKGFIALLRWAASIQQTTATYRGGL